MTFLDLPIPYQKVILVFIFLITITSLCDLFLSIIRKTKIVIPIVTGFIFAFSSLTLISLLAFIKKDDGESYANTCLFFAGAPVFLFIILIIIFLIFIIFVFIRLLYLQNNQVSKRSIKESFDNLPSGICFFEESGLLRLTNYKINSLYKTMFNKPLLNGTQFWEELSKCSTTDSYIKIEKGENPIIILNDKVYSFNIYEHHIKGNKFYELLAIDVTESYKLSLELKEKQKELLDFNKRIREYSDNIEKYIIDKEILDAKIHIHDELGKLLLTTSKCLSNNLTLKEKNDLIKLWDTNLIAFNNMKNDNTYNTYKELYKVAKSIGIDLIIKGSKPGDSIPKKIVITAILECITNTVKHAKGSLVSVIIKEDNEKIEINITNNGNQPQKEIIEGGGLSSLRSLVEQENGEMNIQSLPTFKLVILLKKEFLYEKW